MRWRMILLVVCALVAIGIGLGSLLSALDLTYWGGSWGVILGTLVLLLPLWKPHWFGFVIRPRLREQEKGIEEKITRWYQEHYRENDLTIAKAAKEIGVHPKKLQIILRGFFFTTHNARLNELRLLEASRLLCEEGDRPVGEIAVSVGYNTVSHFNRLFKQRFKHSPQEHRAAFEGNPSSDSESSL